MSRKRKYSPNYIQINGQWYEKVSANSVNVELDLSQDVLEDIDDLVASGKFISRGDCIRTILRRKIEELDSE